VGYPINIIVTGLTAGPYLSVNVSFNDGTAAVQLVGITGYASDASTITKNFSTTGTFKINSTATARGLTGITYYANTLTVNVTQPDYTGNVINQNVFYCLIEYFCVNT
jgi:hypothetical protein